MTFEHKRAGVTHRYEVTTEALVYTAGTKTRLSIPWSEFRAFRVGEAETLQLVPRGRTPLAIWLSPQDIATFLDAAIAAWGAADRDAAAKAAFDYGSDERALGWIWLVVSLLFPGMLSFLLLADGFHTLRCGRLLETGQTAAARVLKVKKNRRGNFTWDLEFTTGSGQLRKGRRTPFVYDAKGHPLGEATVVYSPESESCWELSARPGEKAMNLRQRHLSLMMTMTFGWSFALVAILMSWKSVARLRRRHPFAEAVSRAGAKLIAPAS